MGAAHVSGRGGSHEREKCQARFKQLIRLRLAADFRPRIPILTATECDRELAKLTPPRRRPR